MFNHISASGLSITIHFLSVYPTYVVSLKKPGEYTTFQFSREKNEKTPKTNGFFMSFSLILVQNTSLVQNILMNTQVGLEYA